MATMPLKPVDTVEILMASTDHAKRLPLPPDLFARECFIAEHGFTVQLWSAMRLLFWINDCQSRMFSLNFLTFFGV